MRGAVLHLGKHVHQEHHLAVVRAGDEGQLLAPVLHDEAWVFDALFSAHAF
jgi:hypothetical protein